MIAGILMVIGSLALVSICCLIAYDEGKHRGLEELDGTIEIVRALGAYGALLRVESEATGLPVEKLIERDRLATRPAKVEFDLKGIDDAEFLAAMRRMIRREGGGDVKRALGGK